MRAHGRVTAVPGSSTPETVRAIAGTGAKAVVYVSCDPASFARDVAYFAAAGWGIATLFPAAFRTADNLPGVPSGVGITVVGWFARLGFFLTPPLVGALADALTLRYALWLVPIYALGILAFSGVLSTRRTAAQG